MPTLSLPLHSQALRSIWIIKFSCRDSSKVVGILNQAFCIHMPTPQTVLTLQFFAYKQQRQVPKSTFPANCWGWTLNPRPYNICRFKCKGIIWVWWALESHLWHTWQSEEEAYDFPSKWQHPFSQQRCQIQGVWSHHQTPRLGVRKQWASACGVSQDTHPQHRRTIQCSIRFPLLFQSPPSPPISCTCPLEMLSCPLPDLQMHTNRTKQLFS